MTNSPPAQSEEPPELEIPDSETYDDDFSDEGIFISSFEVSPDTAGELAGGSSSDESTDPESTAYEDLTYAQIISHARVRAALKRPIRLCKFHSVPACVLVLEMEFFETKQTRQLPRLLRFKAVDVTVEFKDAAGSSRLGPEVVMFCPEMYSGEPTVVSHYSSTTVGASVNSSSSFPVGLGVGVHHTQSSQLRKTSACTITGRTLLLGSTAKIIKWELEEDEALKRGVPKQLKFVMAVKIPEERAFSIKLNFTAYLGFGDVQFRVKKEKSVLSTRVDPKMLREQAANHELGPEFGRIWQCLADDVELGEIKLEELTNLNGSTVGRTNGIY
jgi:hypothetical protein